MKKFYTLLIGCLCLLPLAAMAADDDSVIVFVDKDGNVIEDGSELTIRGLTPASQYDDAYISSGLYVRMAENTGASIEVTLTRLDNGVMQCCFPTLCSTIQTLGVTETAKGMLSTTQNDWNIQTEWYPTAFGTCTATLQLKIYAAGLLSPGEFLSYGPKVTINFVYDETSADVEGIAVDDATPVAYYTTDGRQLSSPRQGINIVRYSDGHSAKIVVK